MSRRTALKAVGGAVVASGVVAGGAEASTQRVGELGVVSTPETSRREWHDVSFNSSFDDPVVVMGPLSYGGSDPAHPRIRGLGADGYEWRLEEWSYLGGGGHASERASYMAFEAGVHEVDGVTIEAGTVDADHFWMDAEFTAGFDSPPMLFTAPQTMHGLDPIVSRTKDVTAGGFTIQAREEQSGLGHAVEEMAYIAVSDASSSRFDTGSIVTDHEWASVGESVTDGAAFAASVVTNNGGDPCNVRYRRDGSESVSVRVQEERSTDPEMYHAEERITYLFGEVGDVVASGSGGTRGGSSSDPVFGAYFYTPTDGSDPSADYEDWLGREVTYGEGFIQPESKYDLPGWFSSPWEEWVATGDNRRMNMDTHIKDFATLEEAANGAVDDEYRALGNALVENNLESSSIRIICEYDLGFTVNPQSDQEKEWFKQFWRRSADILHSIDGANLTTVLSPSQDVFYPGGYLEDTYPGDEYVDQLGLSIYDLDYNRYDAGATLTRSDHESSWRGKTLPNLNSMKAFADSHGKEMSIPEWGCWERSGQQGHGGGDNPYYIQHMYDWMVENDVKWHVYFESLDKHSLQPPTQFPEASSRFKQLFGG